MDICLKGLGHEIEFNVFDKNKNLYCMVFELLIGFSDKAFVFAYFAAVKVENIFNSFNESMGNKGGRQVIYQRTLINIIYPTRFHLNRMENDKDAAHERSIFEVEVLI